MGQGNSKSSSSSDDSTNGDGSNSKSCTSRRQRIKKKLSLHRHLHRRGDRKKNGYGSQHPKLSSLEDFAGIALVTIVSAEMRFKDKWLACISIGEQTFRTEISQQTMSPQWNSEKKFLLERNGPHVAKVTVFETNRLSKNHLIGYCEVDLFDFLSQDSDSGIEVKLLDPSPPNGEVGNIYLSCSIEDPTETEKSFARRILSIVDYNGDGQLSFNEFSELINVFGNQHAEKKKVELFNAADENGDGVVSIDELATLLAVQQEKEPLINNCPVCGEFLEVSDKLNSMIHMSLCFDEGTGNQIMTGGFLTDKQASYGWMFKLSEWAHVSSYDAGLNSGSNASHIVVFDRKKKRLVEEIIDGKIVLSMRAIYQSKVGLGIMDKGAKELLQSISERQGKKMNSPESAKDIPAFLKFFKDQINMDEVKYPLHHFKTFNEFFIRELKPGARPVAYAGRDDVAVCAADCRLMAFNTVEESQRFWIKGKKFSLSGLLGNTHGSDTFNGGTLVIFRLAPQDYHRFHFPVSGKIEHIVNIPGCLYTVNPIAVNSKYCNVFTENKRAVSIISTADFGKVAFVAIGATMVGSIEFTKKKGDYVQKGDEFGYFSFGGSTVICVFEKNSIAIDEDLLAYSARSIETLVSVGMQLGVSVRKRTELPLPDINNIRMF
ncbi:putative phosphatidylserine decarboxylase [Helianthus annuus]|uniref:Phosphatidylserine decarboxylase proenzyme 2 n=1 Tax=Helianthus annuus TaxID=4232 RepID=A0A251V5L2_HELAN|nr:phosphatidylserine decarboxylase proenzyme 2 [Helianthus annuus]KAF5813747.1 putative phosphatidylserine decarboxylase [Helianthus annuus]